jgi:Ca2+-binding EF-hand superfamily protein
MKAFLLVSAAAMLATGSAASAQQPTKPVSRADYLKNVDARFNAADTNHDGKISRDELVAAQAHDLAQAKAKIAAELQAKFRQLDTNKDGKLSLDEFMAAAPPLKTAQTPDQVLQALDSNHDGKVSLDEFRAPQIATFNRIDTNHDGTVTPQEMQAAQGRK